MKETGLLFTPENYDKVVTGQKVQTRRILKWQPDSSGAILGPREMEEQPCVWLYNGQRFTCPYGTAGDRLYCKQAHYLYGSWFKVLVKGKVRWRFAYDQGEGVHFRDNPPAEIQTKKTEQGWFLRSPLHMPKWAARLWLEITEVRVERIQQISYDDEGREGVTLGPKCNDRHSGFIALWESIHGKGSWQRNDWVWVLSYKVVQP